MFRFSPGRGGGGFEKVEKHLLMLHKGKQEDWQA